MRRPVPDLGDEDVLICVAAAGINRGDIAQRLGRYPPPPGASDIPGLEVSGTVMKTGRAVHGWAPGAQVCALLTGGGYAEYAAVPSAQCLPVPDGVRLVDAAALPEAFCTVWGSVWKECALAANESLLVQGGASGIGVAAIQMATALGHRVFATAGSAERCRICEDLGAARAINYRTEDFARVVKEETEGRGVDVILDMVGGSYVSREIDTLADHGRLIFIAALGGEDGTFRIHELMRRRLKITGSTLRSRPVEYKGAIVADLISRVWPHFASRRVRPIVDRCFALQDAAAAHALFEQGLHVGKILLVV